MTSPPPPGAGGTLTPVTFLPPTHLYSGRFQAISQHEPDEAVKQMAASIIESIPDAVLPDPAACRDYLNNHQVIPYVLSGSVREATVTAEQTLSALNLCLNTVTAALHRAELDVKERADLPNRSTVTLDVPPEDGKRKHDSDSAAVSIADNRKRLGEYEGQAAERAAGGDDHHNHEPMTHRQLVWSCSVEGIGETVGLTPLLGLGVPNTIPMALRWVWAGMLGLGLIAATMLTASVGHLWRTHRDAVRSQAEGSAVATKLRDKAVRATAMYLLFVGAVATAIGVRVHAYADGLVLFHGAVAALAGVVVGGIVLAANVYLIVENAKGSDLGDQLRTARTADAAATSKDRDLDTAISGNVDTVKDQSLQAQQLGVAYDQIYDEEVNRGLLAGQLACAVLSVHPFPDTNYSQVLKANRAQVDQMLAMIADLAAKAESLATRNVTALPPLAAVSTALPTQPPLPGYAYPPSVRRRTP